MPRPFPYACHMDLTASASRKPLRRFGLYFDTPAYFAEYLSLLMMRRILAVSAAYTHHNLLQKALLEHLRPLPARCRNDLGARILHFQAHCLKPPLTMDGFHRHTVGGLQESLEDLRAEAAKLYPSASTDQLTGAMSFSHAMKMLDRQINKAEESRKPLCVMMADLDFFKRVNDKYGHLVGDIVLKLAVPRKEIQKRQTN